MTTPSLVSVVAAVLAAAFIYYYFKIASSAPPPPSKTDKEKLWEFANRFEWVKVENASISLPQEGVNLLVRRAGCVDCLAENAGAPATPPHPQPPLLASDSAILQTRPRRSTCGIAGQWI